MKYNNRFDYTTKAERRELLETLKAESRKLPNWNDATVEEKRLILAYSADIEYIYAEIDAENEAVRYW